MEKGSCQKCAQSSGQISPYSTIKKKKHMAFQVGGNEHNRDLLLAKDLEFYLLGQQSAVVGMLPVMRVA